MANISSCSSTRATASTSLSAHIRISIPSERAQHSFEREERALRAREIERNAVTQSIWLPAHGMFRLSRFGRLEQLLDADLADTESDRTVDVLSSRGIRAIITGSNSIDFVYERERAFEVIHVDVRAMQIARTFTLPKTTHIAGMYSTSAGAHLYWHRESGELIKDTADQEQKQTLTRFDPSVYAAIRVIAATD